MALNINGTTGISGIDGSVSAPPFAGTDSNSGISFPAADTIKFSTGGIERLQITNNAVSADGHIIQTIHKDYRTFFSTNTLIPLDDTIPQNTEGAEVFTQAITPSSSSNFIHITVVLNMSNSNVNNLHVAAVFKDSGANAIGAGWAKCVGTNAPSSPMVINFTDSPNTTSAVTYKVRVGYSGNIASVVQVNGGSGLRYLGGALASGMTLKEVAA